MYTLFDVIFKAAVTAPVIFSAVFSSSPPSQTIATPRTSGITSVTISACSPPSAVFTVMYVCFVSLLVLSPFCSVLLAAVPSFTSAYEYFTPLSSVITTVTLSLPVMLFTICFTFSSNFTRYSSDDSVSADTGAELLFSLPINDERKISSMPAMPKIISSFGLFASSKYFFIFSFICTYLYLIVFRGFAERAEDVLFVCVRINYYFTNYDAAVVAFIRTTRNFGKIYFFLFKGV